MAHRGGVVTQHLTQISEMAYLHNVNNAAGLARLLATNMLNNDQEFQLPIRRQPGSGAERVGDASSHKDQRATEQVVDSSSKPTPARDRASAANQKVSALPQTSGLKHGSTNNCSAPEDLPHPNSRERRSCEETRNGPELSSSNQNSAPAKEIAYLDDESRYQQLQSPLFGKLPAELRLQVWEYVLTPEHDIDRPTVSVGVLESCRRAYDETKIRLYELNQIRAHLLKSPVPGASNHWSRFLSPAQQAAAYLHLYVQPGTSNAYGWNMLRWTKQLNFHPGALQLTIWFTSGIGWWQYYMRDILKNLSSMRGIKKCILEFRTGRDRFAEFDKHIQELYVKDIKLADGNILSWNGVEPEYWEGSRVMMDNVYGRTTRLSEKDQPRWIRCQDPEQPGQREMLAIVVNWHLKVLEHEAS